LTAPEGIIVKGEGRSLFALEGSFNGTTTSIDPCGTPKHNHGLGDGISSALLLQQLRRVGALVGKAILLQLIQPIIIAGIRCLFTETYLVGPGVK